jgi:hypothetical protein
MHAERTAGVGQHDLDDVPGHRVHFHQVPMSDPRVNASCLRPAFSAGLLNFNAIAVSSMLLSFVRRPRQLDPAATPQKILLDENYEM